MGSLRITRVRVVALAVIGAAGLSAAGCATTIEGTGEPIDKGDDLGDGDPAGPDAGAAEDDCLIAPALGALGAASGSAVVTTQTVDGTAKRYTYQVAFAAGPPVDMLWIDLYEGYGGFTAGVVPGSYPIAGSDADPIACGACIYVAADVAAEGAARLYLARSGTLTLTSIEGTMAGTLTGASFEALDPASGALVPSTCTTSIASAIFDEPVNPI